ncbi:hypothetical protein D7S86_06280 [Pararobbsia silviterrae]|uniref:Uncharacterized protein n=1 Tax=Pararobbsia silviterrae TaxID=1792498 RepID=A0A494Y649_9BURK|nr:hypothetical protein D7S86_06280 [Pararobbsia silviterrae]
MRKTEATILSEPDRANGGYRVDDGNPAMEGICTHMRLPVTSKPECAACAHTKAPATRGPLLLDSGKGVEAALGQGAGEKIGMQARASRGPRTLRGVAARVGDQAATRS